MAVDVREATEADLGRVTEIAEAAWGVAHEPIVGADAVASFLAAHYGRESFEPYLSADRALLAVAEDDDAEVVGFVSVSPDEDAPGRFNLGRIYVDPDRWGEGVGRQLLDHAESAVTDRGGERIRLGVMVENDRAVGFYESAGYDRVDDFYDDRLDVEGYTYEKAL
ncbi:MAG: GNAT family N-acetyltransferase [Halobacteriales archaeon]|nr:GNAT family N-acetyltransferase [Halobacteriales archaeon]